MARKEYHFAPEYMDYAAMAHYTCYTISAVRKWYRYGRLPAVRIDGNGDPRFRRRDIDAFMERHLQSSLTAIAEDITASL